MLAGGVLPPEERIHGEEDEDEGEWTKAFCVRSVRARSARILVIPLASNIVVRISQLNHSLQTCCQKYSNTNSLVPLISYSIAIRTHNHSNTGTNRKLALSDAYRGSQDPVFDDEIIRGGIRCVPSAFGHIKKRRKDRNIFTVCCRWTSI